MITLILKVTESGFSYHFEVISSDKEPLKNIISPPINEYYPGGGVHQRQVSGLSGAPALPVSQSLDAQFKARSWPRNPGTNSLGIQFLPDGIFSFISTFVNFFFERSRSDEVCRESDRPTEPGQLSTRPCTRCIPDSKRLKS